MCIVLKHIETNRVIGIFRLSFLYLLFYVMDLKEMYLSREGRLPRGKFFWYMVLAGIGMGFIAAILNGSIDSYYANVVINLLFNLLWLYLIIALMYKREHDLNHDGKEKVRLIVILEILFYSIVFVSSIMFTLVPAFIEYSSVIAIVMFVISIVIIIQVWPLLFTAWTVWKNQYGPDPLEKK